VCIDAKLHKRVKLGAARARVPVVDHVAHLLSRRVCNPMKLAELLDALPPAKPRGASARTAQVYLHPALHGLLSVQAAMRGCRLYQLVEAALREPAAAKGKGAAK
jgi:predicted HicB family RNase H-like nuclease